MMSGRKDLINILLKGVDAVKPENIIKNSVSLDCDTLYVQDKKYNLKKA